MKTKLLHELVFSLKFFETCTSNFLQLISSQPLFVFRTGDILSSEKNLFLVLHGAFENNKTINLLIGLLNQDPSGWN